MLRAADEAVEVRESLLQVDRVRAVVEQREAGDEAIAGVEDVHPELLELVAADEEGQGFDGRGFFHYY